MICITHIAIGTIYLFNIELYYKFHVEYLMLLPPKQTIFVYVVMVFFCLRSVVKAINISL